MSLTGEQLIGDEVIQRARIYGLIAEHDLDLYEVMAPEDEELTLFDKLCEETDGGWVKFRDRIVRLDHRMENGSEVRSVVEITGLTDEGHKMVTSNLIQHDEKFYLEIHPAYCDNQGVVTEPGIGSSDVSPAPHSAYVIHYQVAYEATPVSFTPPTLPEVA